MTEQSGCSHLAATLSCGFVAVFVKAFARITVAGATHRTAPPPRGARLLHSVGKRAVQNIYPHHC